MFKKKEKQEKQEKKEKKPKGQKEEEKKTLLSQPPEAYNSFLINEVNHDGNDVSQHVAEAGGLSNTSMTLEDDKLIDEASGKKRGSSKKKDVFVRLHAKDISCVDAASATVQLQLTVYLTWEDRNYRNDKDGNLTVKMFDPEVEISLSLYIQS